MSAYVVGNDTINRIVSYLEKDTSENRWDRSMLAKAAGIETTDPDFAEKLGQELLLLNVDSVNRRYEENDLPPDYEYKRTVCSKMQLFKTLGCYLYQSCEGGCDETELFKAVQLFQFSIAKDIIYDLPAYENCEWD